MTIEKNLGKEIFLMIKSGCAILIIDIIYFSELGLRVWAQPTM